MNGDVWGKTKELVTDEMIRCWNCNTLAIEQATRPWRFRCRKCKSLNASPPGAEPLEGSRRRSS